MSPARPKATTRGPFKLMGFLALFLGGLVLAVGAPSAQADPLEGQAFGISANVTVLPEGIEVDVPPTPLVNCPPDTADSVGSLSIPAAPGLEIDTGLVEAECSTVDGVVSSTANAADVRVTRQVTAAVVAAECTANGAPTGSSTVADLVIAGTPILVTGEPNQVVDVPRGFGTVTINRQTSTDNPDGSATLTVDALVADLTFADDNGTATVDVVLSSVSCTSSIPVDDGAIDDDGYGPDADADDGTIDDDDADADADADADLDAGADAGRDADADADGVLPRTGSDSGAQVGIGLVMIGAALLAAFLLTAAGRRQRTSYE